MFGVVNLTQIVCRVRGAHLTGLRFNKEIVQQFAELNADIDIDFIILCFDLLILSHTS